ncbi:MAG: amino acid adenylation domain-containing protein [Micromonosporaceae bacterium]
MAWLETVSRLGATISGGPNFAFDLCVRKSTPEQRRALDLSRWAVAFCGAEPVRADTLDRFAEAFAEAGFRREAFYPCFGLAEATLIVTGGRRGHGARRSGRHVSSGAVLGEQRLAIVDHGTGRGLPPGAEGEIWVSGPSVASGYWKRPHETVETFRASLVTDPLVNDSLVTDPQRRYLRTGDLGYLDELGELVVTGRVKDMIIVRGRNVHPQDLEHAVEQSVPGVRPGCTAAFGYERDAQESIGLACEVTADTDPSATAAAIRRVLSETGEVSVSAVILLPRGRIPKTSSGKIQRHACREAYLDGRFPATWSEPAPGPVPVGMVTDPGGMVTDPAESDSDPVLERVSQVLGASAADISAQQPLIALGLDSLRAAELAHRLRSELGIEVSLSEVLGGVTLAELAARPRGAPLGPLPAPSAQAPGSVEAAATDGQRALWFAQQWAPGSTVYQVSRAARIRSRLDGDRLEQALRELVTRHPALRTSLPSYGGEPVQRITPWTGSVLARHEAPDMEDGALRQLVQQDSERLLDLEAGPLFRASLYTRAADDHVLLLTLHHTITDFWSLSVLVDELLRLYRNPPPSRPQPPAPPQLQRLPSAPAVAGEPEAAPDLPDRLAYWRRALAGAPPALDLPTTCPRPRLQSFRGESQRFAVGDLAPLAAFARANGLTLFTVLLSGWLAALARHTGDDVVTGIATSGRNHPQLRDALGYFTQPLPIRARLGSAMTFRELTSQVRLSVLGALEHGAPFARLVEAVRPERDPSRPVLFQSMFVLQAAPVGRPNLAAFAVGDESVRTSMAGLDVAPFPLVESGSAFDLTLMLASVDEVVTGVANYCSDLYDEPTIARLTRHFTTMLSRAVAAPDVPLRSLDLMAEPERAQVLEFGRGRQAPTPEVTLPQLLERQVELHRHRPAVVCGDQELTYAGLAERAGRVAATLRNRHGVKPGSVVGVRMPRGIDAVVAFWGVLKAGGIYLPLEPKLPPKRLEWMLGDARPDTVLTEEVMRRLDPDQFRGDPGTSPDDAAYLMYTSGSTGRPKGVLVGHRGAVNLGPALASVIGLAASDRMLQHASCAFDAWIFEVLVTHSTGAALVVTPEEAATPGEQLTEVLARQRVTAAHFSPSTLAALPDARLPDLRCLMTGGEACPPELVTRWGKGRAFFNLYGPTEATVCASGGRSLSNGKWPSIGPPVPNVLTYVLDPDRRLVPVGVPGELWIGGVGVAKGYLNRPDLTAKHFIPNPYGEGMLYRSGDRARWLPDGALGFLGRLDDQVKIRGVRVEPGEVEVRLRELLGLREAAVVAATSSKGTELVAYLVCPQPRPSISELRGMLRPELPDPWIPAAYVFLESLPRNTSGKLDRAALPAATPEDRGVTTFLAPRTDLETAIAQVWSGLLDQPAVGVHDHFFDELGGTSLMVARVASELGRRLGREVPVTHLFEHPTVEALARRLAEDRPRGKRETAAGRDLARARRRALADRRERGA